MAVLPDEAGTVILSVAGMATERVLKDKDVLQRSERQRSRRIPRDEVGLHYSSWGFLKIIDEKM